jgi:hypothetical protein
MAKIPSSRFPKPSHVETPPVGDLTLKDEDFLKIWKKHLSVMKQLEVILAPATDAIKQRFFKRQPAIVKWGDTELHSKDNVNYNVVITVEWFEDRRGEMDENAYTIPLHAALAGTKAVNDFFDEEDRKQQEEAKRLGLLKEARDKDQRRELYLKLKAEFDNEEKPEGTTDLATLRPASAPCTR